MMHFLHKNKQYVFKKRYSIPMAWIEHVTGIEDEYDGILGTMEGNGAQSFMMLIY